MTAKGIRRSLSAHRRKLFTVWTIALFFLALAVALVIVFANNHLHHEDDILNAAVDLSKIHFEGLTIDEQLPNEVLGHEVIDAEFDYSWRNISISVDAEKNISRLGFFTTTPIGDENATDGSNIEKIDIDYRGYPLRTASDFATYFGYAKITNYGHYKYMTYQDEKYAVDLTLMDGNVYNVVLYRKTE